MDGRQMSAAGCDDADEFINEYEAECQCEFIDPRFLATTALDSNHAALDYFYQSPFYQKYREGSLNELMRAGTEVDSQQVGLIFQVTYSNLNDVNEALANLPPLDEPARIQHYCNSTLFHITLFSRNLGQNGLTTTPIKVYYIIQGSIFLCPPFGSLLRHRLHESIQHFENFYDTLNDIVKWSSSHGYVWEPKKKILDPQIEMLCNKYNFKENEDENFIKDGNMHIFYLKPHESAAMRISQHEIKVLSKKLAELQELTMENTVSIGTPRSQESNETQTS
nr:conserved hypothetical protein [Babesia bovis]